MGKKKLCIHYFTGQKRGLSGLKNIWPVTMTGDLLSIILSPALMSSKKKQKPKTNKKMGKEKQPKQEVDKVKKVLVEEVCQCHF